MSDKEFIGNARNLFFDLSGMEVVAVLKFQRFKPFGSKPYFEFQFAVREPWESVAIYDVEIDYADQMTYEFNSRTNFTIVK